MTHCPVHTTHCPNKSQMYLHIAHNTLHIVLPYTPVALQLCVPVCTPVSPCVYHGMENWEVINLISSGASSAKHWLFKGPAAGEIW